MPPKAAPVVTPVGQKVSVSVRVSKPVDFEGGKEQHSTRGLRLRAFFFSATDAVSLSALTTPLFGEKEGPFAWNESETESGSESRLVSTAQYSFEKEIKDVEQLRSFHEDAGIYFFFQFVDNGTLRIVNMFHLDLSIFLVDASQPIHLHRRVYEQYEVDIKVSMEETFKNWDELLDMNPVVLRLKSINSFPIFPNEDQQTAIDGTYAYGVLKIGSSLTKRILAFPSTVPVSKQVGSETVQKYPFDLKICMIPGLADLSFFKDLIASSTFSIDVYQDDLLSRCFSVAHNDEYIKLVTAEPGGLGLPAAAPVAAPAGKKAAAPPKGAPEPGQLVMGTLQPSDKYLVQILLDGLHKSKLIRAHGCAKFRLEQLLEKSNDLLTKFKRKRNGASPEDDHVIVKEDMALEVRLEKPSKPEKWDLPEEMSLIKALDKARKDVNKVVAVKNPSRHERYLVSGTTLTITAELHRKLDTTVGQIDSDLATQTIKFGKTLTVGVSNLDEKHDLSDDELQRILSETPFTRMIVTCKYGDDDIVSAINDGVNAVNSRALPDIQGTMRSYSLTPNEVDESIKGKLDLISGFMIIDDDQRLIVLEGLAAPSCGMEWLYTDYLPRLNDNNESLKIVCNPEVLFPERIYPEYSPDLRRIRVRGKLKKLARRPEIYNRKQVEEICFLAVDGLMALRRSEDLLSTKQLDMYPAMTALNKLELLYGEAISRADMDGTMKKQFLQTFDDRQLKEQHHQHHNSHPDTNEELNQSAYQRKHGEFHPTDCRNAQFEEYLKTRPQHRIDYLDENRRARRQAWSNMLHRRQERSRALVETMTRILGTTRHDNTSKSGDDGSEVFDDQLSKTENEAIPMPKVYLYSIQSENFKTKAWKELRHRIAADHHTNYTLSKDFLSQSISPIDEAEEKVKAIVMEKSARLTQKGFLYPKPKTRKEMIEHPRKPADARIEDLKEPFADSLDRKATMGVTADPVMLAREHHFQNQIKPEKYFGALELPEYEKEFQLKLIGDRSQLPRGDLVKGSEKNPHFFRSVHLGGENQRKIIEEAQAKEKEDWHKKLVVDTIDFKVGGFKVRDTPIPVDRCNDILKDDAKTAALKTLRERTSHKGEDLSYTTTPLTLMNTEPFVQSAAAKAMTRSHDHTKFITAAIGETNVGGQPKDFTRYIHEHTDKPKMISQVHKRKHPPLDKNHPEFTGPRWDPPQL